MALNLVTKGGLVLVGGTSVATGSYFIYSHISSQSKKPETFKSKIEALGKALINGNNDQWAVKVAVYGKDGNAHKIKVNNQIKDTVTKEDLESWCSENLKQEYSDKDSSTLSLVEKWCVTPTIKEALSKENGTMIPTDGELNSGWQTKIGAKQSNVQNDLINTLKLKASSSENTVAPETLRDWCKGQLEKEYTSETSNNYDLTKSWCLQG